MPLVTAGQGMLRTSRADREHVIRVLQMAFVQGRLTQDEFEARIGRTLTSRTYAELSVVTADLPALLVGSQLPRMNPDTPDRRSTGAAAKLVVGGFIGLAVSIVALVAGVLAVANLLAAVPALLAARSDPARLLRAE